MAAVDGHVAAVDGHVDDLDAGAAEELDAVVEAVLLVVDDALDAGLDDELGALDAGRGGDVERGTVAVVAAAGELGDGVGLGVENVGLGDVVVVLADVLEAAGGTVVAVADDHLLFDDEGADLTTPAVGVLGPDARHTEVALVEGGLFWGFFLHE